MGGLILETAQIVIILGYSSSRNPLIWTAVIGDGQPIPKVIAAVDCSAVERDKVVPVVFQTAYLSEADIATSQRER